MVTVPPVPSSLPRAWASSSPLPQSTAPAPFWFRKRECFPGLWPACVEWLLFIPTQSKDSLPLRNMLECSLDEVEAVVLDNGSHSLKVGFSGEDLPRSVVPALRATITGTGEADDGTAEEGLNPKTEVLLGKEAWTATGKDVELTYPIQNGMVVEKDAMEDLWESVLNKYIPGETEDTVYLLTCPVLASIAVREWIFEVFFEKFKCRYMALLQPGPLSLFSSGEKNLHDRLRRYSRTHAPSRIRAVVLTFAYPSSTRSPCRCLSDNAGRSRGLVVEIGHSVSSAVPVFEGFPLGYSTFRMFRAGDSYACEIAHSRPGFQRVKPEFPRTKSYMNVDGVVFLVDAGGAITGALSQILGASPCFDRLTHFHTPVVTERMKHELCCVAIPDLQTKLQQPDTSGFEERAFQLPDGSVIELDQRVRFGPAELLFDDSVPITTSLDTGDVSPSLLSEVRPFETIQSLVHAAITATDPEYQEEMQKNIVLAGGSSLIRNLPERLHGELVCLDPREKDPFSIVTDSQRRYSAWVGGSMLASLGTFEKFCVTREEYDDGNRSLGAMIHERNMGR